jgi:hypothetical protein
LVSYLLFIKIEVEKSTDNNSDDQYYNTTNHLLSEHSIALKDESEYDFLEVENHNDCDWYEIVTFIHSKINSTFSIALATILVFTVGILWSTFYYPETKFLIILSENDTDYVKDQAYTYIPILTGMVVLFIIIYTTIKNILKRIGSELILNCRVSVYEALVEKPIEYFETAADSPGNMKSLLASEIQVVNGASIEHYLMFYEVM